jgi:hypothetical protein
LLTCVVLHAFQGDVHQNQNFSIRVEQSVPPRGVAAILGLERESTSQVPFLEHVPVQAVLGSRIRGQ